MIEPSRTNQGSTGAHRDELNEGEVLYACPACGVVVSNHDLAAMRLHHLHVINPEQIDPATKVLRERIEAARAEEDSHRARHALLAGGPRFTLASG